MVGWFKIYSGLMELLRNHRFRSNNHVEDCNFILNNDIDIVHPNILS